MELSVDKIKIQSGWITFRGHSAERTSDYDVHDITKGLAKAGAFEGVRKEFMPKK